LDTEVWAAVGSGATAIAAIFAAVSAYGSLKATREMERELEDNRKANAYRLLNEFENSYRTQYPEIMNQLGPWPDPGEEDLDPAVRRVVHDLLVSLCSVYRSSKSNLVPDGDVEYVATLFSEWLQNPMARHIWESVFRNQNSWPSGFVPYVDEMLARPSLWDMP
jgi:hypothetical protein